jgi:hypothetical protein
MVRQSRGEPADSAAPRLEPSDDPRRDSSPCDSEAGVKVRRTQKRVGLAGIFGAAGLLGFATALLYASNLDGMRSAGSPADDPRIAMLDAPGLPYFPGCCTAGRSSARASRRLCGGAEPGVEAATWRTRSCPRPSLQ